MSGLEEAFVFADKPTGISTHSPDSKILGFVEYLSIKLNTKLFVCHRLDKETSGVILFAKSKEVAAAVAELFEKHQVQKKYLFVTDQKSPNLNELQIESEIIKKGNSFLSQKSLKPNSKTKFKKHCELGKFTVWEAYPESGKTHQIRLHAKDLGIAILGDSEHGGTNFPRLMLHSAELSFKYQGQLIGHQSVLPESFNSTEILGDLTLAQYFSSLDRRQRLFDWKLDSTNTIRLIHNQGWGMSADLLGEYLWCYWFDEQLPAEKDLLRIKKLAEVVNVKGWKVQLMENRGQVPVAQHNLSTIDVAEWIGKENGVNYVFKKEQGNSPGLFLDQRQNRAWVQRNSQNKKVLNLFCYTAGFSVCAALGGASEVVSVDTSKATLDWGKENFKANNLEPEKYEFWAADARYFIAGAKKKDRLFDLIICDPPSFARNKQGVFKLDRDFKDLAKELYLILAPKGRILFSLNLEKWDDRKFQEEIYNLKLTGLRIEASPIRDLDYEMPGQEVVMKSLFIVKH